uniref:Uncharacterized protein n=1 Tax=Opuntia streptacantha TaxID=393608 RepID=A0A7C9DS12_OPUST
MRSSIQRENITESWRKTIRKSRWGFRVWDWELRNWQSLCESSRIYSMIIMDHHAPQTTKSSPFACFTLAFSLHAKALFHFVIFYFYLSFSGPEGRKMARKRKS